MHRKTGFTLIELLVVIGIMGVWFSLILPAVASIKEKCRSALCQSNLHQVGVAFQLYLQDYNDVYPCTGNLLLWNGRYWRWPIKPYISLGTDPAGGNPLVADRKDDTALRCPSDLTAVNYDGTSYAYSMAFYFSPEQINAMDTFSATITPPGPPCTAQRDALVAFPAHKALVTEWVSNHEAPHLGWYDPNTAWKGGRNYQFADGHGQYLKSDQIHPANDKLPDINLTRDGIRGKDRD